VRPVVGSVQDDEQLNAVLYCRLGSIDREVAKGVGCRLIEVRDEPREVVFANRYAGRYGSLNL
jgi:hypothetical protein